jgi:CBS domain-containing protein
MRIAEILHHKGKHVSKIGTTDSVEVAVRRLDEQRIGALVVVDHWGVLAGMFSERDVTRALACRGAATLGSEVREFMTPDVTTCGPDDRINEVMATMTAHRIRHLPVMENGRLVGIVSIGDLVKAKLVETEQEANVLRDINLSRL